VAIPRTNAALADFIAPRIDLGQRDEVAGRDRIPARLRGKRLRQCVDGDESSLIQGESDLFGPVPQHERDEPAQADSPPGVV
jgi:hypothetical protein